MKPLGNYLFARLLDAEAETTLCVPETARDEACDALVLEAGPGALLASGARYPMQAAPGDRVLFRRCDWRQLEALDGLVYGFLSDARAVALLPSPHVDLLPAAGYALVRPDTLYVVDPVLKGTVRRSDSPVLSVCAIGTGGSDWAEREGELAYRESERLWDSPEWQAEPIYYRHRRLHNYLDGLHPDVRRVARRLARNGGRVPQREGRWLRHEAPCAGTLVALGAGSVLDEDGGRRSVLSPVPRPGARVHWDADHYAVALSLPGETLYAIQERFLTACEE